jgi:NAD(P)-dependent dehydrogenase (short-subunit alcohol dehydrogenase family)
MTDTERTALVTGGTRGIGRAVALALAEEGCRVYCWYVRDDQAAQALAAEHAGISIGKVNVTDPDAVRVAVRDLASAVLSIDILVNSAGIGMDGMTAALGDEDWQRALEVNLTGVFHVCREVVREMIYTRSGRIVNVASLAGSTGLPGTAAYSASKGGLMAFTRSLAQEVARFNILANTVSPGMIETDLSGQVPAKRLQEMVEHIPLRRMGTPQEVAQLILFLVSPKNTYITGQDYIIAGGL